MSAVYRRELRAMFTSLTGALFTFFTLLIVGIYASVLHFSGGYASFEYCIGNLSYIFLFLVPLLTMRTFAEETRTGTDRLLHALPLRPVDVVLGKYFALVTVWGVPVTLMCGYPLLLTFYGTPDLATAYSSIFAFFLLGCALLAFGMFLSSLTEHQLIAAVICFGTLLLSYFLPSLAGYLSASGLAAFVILTFLIVTLIVLLRLFTKNIWLSVIVGGCLELPLIAVCLLDVSLLDGTVQVILGALSPFSRLDTFVYGVFDFSAVVYLLSVCFLFVFFTTLRFERRPGGFQLVLTLLAIGCVAAGNLLCSALPASVTRFDTTSEQVFTLSDTSVRLLDALDSDVTVYLLAETGSEDEGLSEILSQCAARTSRLHIETRDPVLYPYFSSQYTTLELPANSLIVVGAQRTTTVDFSVIYVYDETGRAIFDGESEILNAIRYVTADSLPILYTLTGHGELTLSDARVKSVKGEGLLPRPLNLLASDAVPSDAAGVLIASPTADLSQAECEKLAAYLTSGGRLLLYTDVNVFSSPNLDALTEAYGVRAIDGVVLDGNADYYLSGSPFYLLPELGKHEITTPITQEGFLTLTPLVHGLTTVADLPQYLTVTALLYTSESAYSKDVLEMETTEQMPGDESGVFNLGLAVENNNTGARLVWYGTGYLLDDATDQLVSGANAALFTNTIRWLCSQEKGLSIPAKSLATRTIVMTERQTWIWNTVCIGLVPGGILVAGLWIWGKRQIGSRKKRGRK